MAGDGVKAPAHTGHQIFGPAFADKCRRVAACFKKTKGGETHTTVPDVVRKSAENSRHKGNKNSSLISSTSEEREEIGC